MCPFFCLTLIAVAVVGFLIWFVKKADADLTLLFYEKYGKSVDSLKGKVVWITGASSGIGQAVANSLASGGAKLALSGTSEERLQETKNQCLASGKLTEDDILLVPFNISDFSVHEDCVKKVLDHFGTIDILVNNAGRTQRASFQEIEIRVDRDMFDINVFGTVNLTRKVLPHFIAKGGGHLVVTSSVTGKLGVPWSASYTASKHALHGYFECLRAESSSGGIDVTMICPGPTFAQTLLSKAFTGKSGETFGGQQESNEKRMPTSRCAQLISVAIANRVDEAWISLQPILFVFYLAQYTPTFFRSFLVKKFVTKERAAAWREGQS
ncbi:dehydrogenase/reductase SDR family member 7 [Centruroides vittatus]|uniref:dehydrogenase/reductase SDR family member 7 n=1 Tax=Centruroides vittatus TaxID=120091 RepID=UPI0035108379